jgi:hypothetical protein
LLDGVSIICFVADVTAFEVSDQHSRPSPRRYEDESIQYNTTKCKQHLHSNRQHHLHYSYHNTKKKK